WLILPEESSVVIDIVCELAGCRPEAVYVVPVVLTTFTPSTLTIALVMSESDGLVHDHVSLVAVLDCSTRLMTCPGAVVYVAEKSSWSDHPHWIDLIPSPS